MEQHEAYKQEYSDFRQEVSKIALSALVMYNRVGDGNCLTAQALQGIIIPAPKPDPLVEVLVESHIEFGPNWGWEEQAEALRAALESRGWEIREKDA